MKRYLIGFLVVAVATVFTATGCSKGCGFGCTVEDAVVKQGSKLIVSELKCARSDLVVSDIKAAVSKLKMCDATINGVKVDSLPSNLCKAVAPNLIAVLAEEGIPKSWECSPEASVAKLKEAVEKACDQLE